MKIRLQMFARARDLAGAESIELDLPESARVRDLRAALCERCPNLNPIAGSLFIALNDDYADDDRPVRAEDRAACFPPVSGG